MPLLLLFLLFFSPCVAAIDKLTVKVIATYPHETSDFTQGLICDGEFIYESCGLYHQSCLKKYELKTGKLLHQIKLPANFFAEGIALINNQIIQLTWKEKTAFVYDKDTFQIQKKLNYKGEGWGLCQDGEFLWMSNGSDQLVKRDSETFKIQKILTIKDSTKSYGFLNDLICVDNFLYANIWGDDTILQIDKNSGQVTGMINASNLLTPRQKSKLSSGAVLNGIAYKKESRTFLITGKFWPHLFEVTFEKEAV